MPPQIDIVAGAVASNLCGFTNVNNTVLFWASNSAKGDELWKSDGTATDGVNGIELFSLSNPECLTNAGELAVQRVTTW
jgi:hypothetical protein